MVLGSLKDPEWEPPAETKKSKSSMSTGGGGGEGQSNDPPPGAPDVVSRTARHGTEGAESHAARRRPRAARGGTDLLPVRRQDEGHQVARSDLRRPRRKSYPDAPALVS